MKITILRRVLFGSLICCNLLLATNVESEMGINIGLLSTKNSEGSKFKSPTFGLTYQDNTYVLMPRLDLEYVSIKEDSADSLLKGSLNAIYEFENQTNTSPYFLGGIGYEHVQDGVENEFESHPFVQVGAGFNIAFENNSKFNFEAKMLQILGGEDENNEVVLTAGIRFPLSYKKAKVIHRPAPIYIRPAPVVIKPAPIVIKPVPVVVKPSPVLKPVPVVKPSPQVRYINNNECSIKIDLPDLDRDGVQDSVDQCPATPCNFTVDHYGCPIKGTLKINFRTNSSIIEYGSMSKVDDFAQFLLKNKGSMVKIVGHTDNVGTDSNNLALSNRRASSVREALIMKGVSPARLTAEGRGESMPIASNNTIEGRARNRRIEAELTYPRGRE